MYLFNHSLNQGKISPLKNEEYLVALCNGLPSLDHKSRGRGSYLGLPFLLIRGRPLGF